MDTHSVTADPQKDAVYDWEDSWWGWNRNLVTLRKCREVIRFACGLYGVDPPRVKQHNVRSLSWSLPYAGYRQISLQAVGPHGKGGLNYPTALHEASHQIIWDYYGATVQDHGPEFAGVYLWLLEKAGIADRDALLYSAKRFGINAAYQAPEVLAKIERVPQIVCEADPRLIVR